MQFFQDTFAIKTPGRGFLDVTSQINAFIQSKQLKNGLCQVFLAHTSASLIFCENYDPVVREDLEAFFSKLVPDGDKLFKHTAEGPDDMPSHVRTVLTQNSLTIPVMQQKLALGTWQGVFLWEHRTTPHERKMIVTLFGEA